MTTTMRAMVRHDYGGPEQLRPEHVPVPAPGPGEVRIRVAHSSVNPADRYMLLGSPLLVRAVTGLRTPRSPLLGTDAAGEVTAVGPDVADVAVGDRVLGASRGAWAEEAVLPVTRLAPIPAGVATATAAALPIAGATALQALDRGEVAAGDRVLVNGASGGVGHLAVQLAVARGAQVTGVCSTRNLDLVRGLGAADVVDHTTTDYTTLGRTWDVLVDSHGNHGARANRDVLVDGGRWVLVGGPMTSRVWGPVASIVRAMVVLAPSSRRAVQFTAVEDATTLGRLLDHVAAGELAPHVEHAFGLEELAAAIDHLATNRTRGKLLVDVT